jgi:hypothetical protein
LPAERGCAETPDVPDLKTRAVARGLELYLLALLGGVAAAAIIIAAPALDMPMGKRNAEQIPASPARADAIIPAAPAPAIAEPPQTSVAAALPVAAGIAGHAAADFSAVVAISEAAPFWSPGPVTRGEASSADSRATLGPSSAAGISYSLPNAPSVRRRINTGRRQIAGHPPLRARHSRSPEMEAAEAARGFSALRGAGGSGCPAGSDPRWSAADASGAPALICNPYYPRVSVGAF